MESVEDMCRQFISALQDANEDTIYTNLKAGVALSFSTLLCAYNLAGRLGYFTQAFFPSLHASK
jgi:hypothetical protein